MIGFMHCRWVQDAGGSVTAPQGLEVAPLVSYGGEDLAELCSGKTFKQCLDNSLQVCHISDSFARACAAWPCLLCVDDQPVIQLYLGYLTVTEQYLGYQVWTDLYCLGFWPVTELWCLCMIFFESDRWAGLVQVFVYSFKPLSAVLPCIQLSAQGFAVHDLFTSDDILLIDFP